MYFSCIVSLNYRLGLSIIAVCKTLSCIQDCLQSLYIYYFNYLYLNFTHEEAKTQVILKIFSD